MRKSAESASFQFVGRAAKDRNSETRRSDSTRRTPTVSPLQTQFAGSISQTQQTHGLASRPYPGFRRTIKRSAVAFVFRSCATIMWCSAPTALGTLQPETLGIRAVVATERASGSLIETWVSRLAFIRSSTARKRSACPARCVSFRSFLSSRARGSVSA